MSETYVVAARLRLKKKAVTAWLKSPWPDPAMLRWPGEAGIHPAHESPRSVRHGLAHAADGVAADETGGLVAAWDGAARSFLLYHVMIGLQPEVAARSLLAVAAAASHWTQKKPAHALLFAETGARLWTEGVLAVFEVGSQGASFVSVDPGAAVKDLAPAEARWDHALGMGVVEAMHDPSVLQPSIRQVATSPLLRKRKSEVPTYESASQWLEAIAAVRLLPRGETPKAGTDYASWGRFERDIIRYAAQVRRFGPTVAPRLEEMLGGSSYEAGVIAFWALNQLSIETGDPAHYLRAITLWRTFPEAGQGWARGELTDREDEGAKADHAAALAGTRYSARGLLSLVRSKEPLSP